MLENPYKRNLKKRLEQIPNSYFEIYNSRSKRGVPDIFGMVNGVFVALEVKRNLGEANKRGRVMLQKYTLNTIREKGGVAYMVCPENEQEVVKKLKGLVTIGDLLPKCSVCSKPMLAEMLESEELEHIKEKRKCRTCQ